MDFMRVSRLTWTGIGCLALAITTFGGWVLWLETRINRPVYVPVSVSVSHVHVPEFRINLSGLYEISIEAKKTIPFDTLNCLLAGASIKSCTRCSLRKMAKAVEQSKVLRCFCLMDRLPGWNRVFSRTRSTDCPRDAWHFGLRRPDAALASR